MKKLRLYGSSRSIRALLAVCTFEVPLPSATSRKTIENLIKICELISLAKINVNSVSISRYLATHSTLIVSWVASIISGFISMWGWWVFNVLLLCYSADYIFAHEISIVSPENASLVTLPLKFQMKVFVKDIPQFAKVCIKMNETFHNMWFIGK